MDRRAGDRHGIHHFAVALNRQLHFGAGIAAQDGGHFFLLQFERRGALQNLGNGFAVDGYDDVLGQQSGFVGGAVEDHVLDVQILRLIVDRVRDADAAERRAVEAFVQCCVFLRREKDGVAVLHRAEHTRDRRVGDLRRTRQRVGRFEPRAVFRDGRRHFARENLGVGRIVIVGANRRQCRVGDVLLLEVIDHRGARAVERGLLVDLLIEVAGQVRVSLDQLLHLLLRNRRAGGGRTGIEANCEQYGKGQGNEAFH